MNWLQVRINLGEIQVGPVEQALLHMGAVSIEYSDAGDNPIFEPTPGTTPLWNTTQISALFEGGVSETAIQLIVATAIAPTPMPGIHFAILEDQNWVTNWRRDLPPMQFGQHLWICPPGRICPDDQAIAVTMEPGLGFGTGSHATTRLCLEWLSQLQLREKTVLDFGCGSGILGIASLALGASRVTAVDIDAHALTATRENARRNHCLSRMQVVSADCLDPIASFDLIVANILSSTLIGLEPDLRGHSQPGTDIALSGILTSQADDVICAYEQWIRFQRSAEHDDWVILTGTVN
jgi:ribosomal protein L11 methyltransferase